MREKNDCEIKIFLHFFFFFFKPSYFLFIFFFPQSNSEAAAGQQAITKLLKLTLGDNEDLVQAVTCALASLMADVPENRLLLLDNDGVTRMMQLLQIAKPSIKVCANGKIHVFTKSGAAATAAAALPLLLFCVVEHC